MLISSSSPLLLFIFCLYASLICSQAASKWQTLSGGAPLIVARGGVSGIFPDSSQYAYSLLQLAASDVMLWCDVQLTKNESGICAPDVNLANSTNIAKVYTNDRETYVINGASTQGYFSVDYTNEQLSNVSLVQGIYSRPPYFDNANAIQYVEQAADTNHPLWLNIEHDAFFSQHNLSVKSYLLSLTRKISVSYISSPEVAFLKSMTSRFTPKGTKLVFRFLEQDVMEPTTNQTYGVLLRNLTLIRTFASGILIPKSYIWPVDSNLYSNPYTSIVMDAHKVGLEVFAYGFSNDIPFAYNYSFDAAAEVLSHVNNGMFSVDGVLTDFPLTSSIARDCFAHMGKTAPKQVNLTIITKHGASGDYPGCTDLAYQKAISDGADIIDCTVQFSADKVPFCMASVNLNNVTTALQSNFATRSETIADLGGLGVYSFNLTWDEIQTLSPVIQDPFFSGYQLVRNPRFRNAGKFVTLSDFLTLAKNSTSLSGVLIIIENARYLIASKNISVDTLVVEAIKTAGYDNESSKKVMIQSTDSSLLMRFKNTNYELVYDLDSVIEDVTGPAIDDIKSVAQSVRLTKKSVISVREEFLVKETKAVGALLSANLNVFVETFSNEFVSQAWDFLSDPTVEINNYYNSNITGVVTDYPSTASRFRRNRCLADESSVYMLPIQAGTLLNSIVTKSALPPAEPPSSPLSESDVVDPPLPAAGSAMPSTPATPEGKSSAQHPLTLSAMVISQLAVIGAILLQLGR